MSARDRTSGSRRPRARAAAALLIAQVVLSVLFAWSTAPAPGAPRARTRLEPEHATALAPARPIASDDLGRRSPPPPIAVPWSSAPLAIAAAPCHHVIGRVAHVRRPRSHPLSHAIARGPPQAT